jgi:hypothetical protein
MPAYKRTPQKVYDADLVWAAACMAQRINGEYVKSLDVAQAYITNQDLLPESERPIVKDTNRQILTRALEEPNTITDADKEQGIIVRRYYKGLSFKILQGKHLNAFANTALAISNRDEIDSNYDIAIVASLPSCYERAVERDQIDRRISQASGGYMGPVGAKITANIEIVKSVYSQQWNTYYLTAMTDKDQPCFFAYREGMDVGTTCIITGTVKAHRDDSTQLNRVKVR